MTASRPAPEARAAVEPAAAMHRVTVFLDAWHQRHPDFDCITVSGGVSLDASDLAALVKALPVSDSTPEPTAPDEHRELDGCCQKCGPCFTEGGGPCEGYPCPSVPTAQQVPIVDLARKVVGTKHRNHRPSRQAYALAREVLRLHDQVTAVEALRRRMAAKDARSFPGWAIATVADLDAALRGDS